MQTLRGLNLNSLRIAESAARNGSFIRAAEEQLLTPSAVSQRIKALEAQLRFRLFMRTNNSVVLTSDGEAFIQRVREGLDMILAAKQAATDPQREQTLKIRSLPTFLMRWLLQRLPSFQARCPDIILNLSSSYALPDFAREDLDIGIYYGRGDFGDLRTRLLFREDLTPVCAPQLLAKITRPRGIAINDLKHFTLLYSATCTLNWKSWLEHAKGSSELLTDSRAMHLDTCMLTFEAALAGLGFACANRAYVAEDLKAGRLVAPFDVVHPNQNGWYLVSSPHRPQFRSAELFQAWIGEQILESEAQILRLKSLSRHTGHRTPL